MVAPDSSWAYKTVPQKHLLGRRLDYLRGKGLGGTSTINSSAWTVGPCDGFVRFLHIDSVDKLLTVLQDEWARLVGDESFDWAHIRKRLQHIEAYNITENPAHAKYYKPNVADHGSAGPVSISIDDEWEGGFTGLLDTLTDAGLPMNTDINSGHPLGVGVTPATAHRHRRITAATAYLWNPPPNLTILTNATVSKVLMKDKRAVGVEVDGKKCESDQS